MAVHPDEITKEQILDFRKRKGFSQQDLAQLLGVSLPTIKRWESGESTPRDRHLVALATLLSGVSATGVALTSLGLASALVPSFGLGPAGPLLVALGALAAGFVASRASSEPMPEAARRPTSNVMPAAPERPTSKAMPEAAQFSTSEEAIRQLEQVREQVILQLPVPLSAQDRAKAEKVRLELDIDRVLFDKFLEEANVRGFTPSRLCESLLWMFMEMPPLSFQTNDPVTKGLSPDGNNFADDRGES